MLRENLNENSSKDLLNEKFTTSTVRKASPAAASWGALSSEWNLASKKPLDQRCPGLSTVLEILTLDAVHAVKGFFC